MLENIDKHKSISSSLSRLIFRSIYPTNSHVGSASSILLNNQRICSNTIFTSALYFSTVPNQLTVTGGFDNSNSVPLSLLTLQWRKYHFSASVTIPYASSRPTVSSSTSFHLR